MIMRRRAAIAVVVLSTLFSVAIAAENAAENAEVNAAENAGFEGIADDAAPVRIPDVASDTASILPADFKLPDDANWLDHILLTILQDPWTYATYLAMFTFPLLCISMWASWKVLEDMRKMERVRRLTSYYPAFSPTTPISSLPFSSSSLSFHPHMFRPSTPHTHPTFPGAAFNTAMQQYLNATIPSWSYTHNSLYPCVAEGEEEQAGGGLEEPR